MATMIQLANRLGGRGARRRRIAGVFQAWIESVLPAPLTGPVEVTKEVPWSMVAVVPTERGRFWFQGEPGGHAV